MNGTVLNAILNEMQVWLNQMENRTTILLITYIFHANSPVKETMINSFSMFLILEDE
jgi:hypothetical protein